MKIQYFYITIFFLFLFGTSNAQTPILNSYSSATATIYLDFNGSTIEGTIWNEQGKITTEPTGLSPVTIKWIHRIISENFNLFNLNITTDPLIYNNAPIRQRMRVIFSPDGSWFGYTTGVSAIGSFTWGNETPAFVFLNALSNDPTYIAKAATHEIGHTLGLQHQAVYNNQGAMISEFSGGENNIYSNETAFMGVPFYKKAKWQNGPSSLGATTTQSDTAIIAGAPNNIGYRKNQTEQSTFNKTVIIERQDISSVCLSSPGDYQYRLFDMEGRILTEGRLKTGSNQIPIGLMSKGVLVLQWYNESISGSQKFIH